MTSAPSDRQVPASPERADHAPFEGRLASAVVELTNRCNLRCVHCASNSGEARHDELSTDEWRAAFEALAELGCGGVTLIGGEVFLRRDWVELARHVTALGMQLDLVTNGLVFGPRTQAALDELDVHLVGVSVDGATPETYAKVRGVDALERVWETLETLRDRARFPVVAITSASRLNLHELEAIGARVRAAGITWQLQFVHAVGERFDRTLMLSPEEHARVCRWIGDELLTSDPPWLAAMDDFGYYPLDAAHAPLHQDWAGCQAGQMVVGLRANGDVLGCLSLGDDFVEGNLRQTPLSTLWRDPARFARFRRKAERLTGACKACPHGERCRAGCSAMAHAATGGLGENPYCMRRVECQALVAQMLG